jgi:hypothetical protein
MKRKLRASAAKPKVRSRSAAGSRRIGRTGRRRAVAKSGRTATRKAVSRLRTANKSSRRKARTGRGRSRSYLEIYNASFDAAYNEGYNAGFAEGFQAEQARQA